MTIRLPSEIYGYLPYFRQIESHLSPESENKIIYLQETCEKKISRQKIIDFDIISFRSKKIYDPDETVPFWIKDTFSLECKNDTVLIHKTLGTGQGDILFANKLKDNILSELNIINYNIGAKCLDTVGQNVFYTDVSKRDILKIYDVERNCHKSSINTVGDIYEIKPMNEYLVTTERGNMCLFNWYDMRQKERFLKIPNTDKKSYVGVVASKAIFIDHGFNSLNYYSLLNGEKFSKILNDGESNSGFGKTQISPLD
jgi:hypothetical protein